MKKQQLPVDLNNKGIGPMEDLVFDAAIDEAMVATGAAAF